jgi:hypothetical protein
MKVLDLFAGIGGFSLAAHWMGWQTAAFCEQNEFCHKVLRKNFGSDITIHEDVCELDGHQYRGTVDVVCGGFPCQPYSSAGKQKGTEDARHLWPEMLRVISEVQPRYVVGENVFGLVNWSGGLVFDEVQADLEIEGFEVIPFYFQLVPKMLHTGGTASGLWPTPSKGCARAAGYPIASMFKSWSQDGHQIRTIHLLAANGLNIKQIAEHYEMMMGFPIRWTELEPSETA